jgi:hypothetical protein
MIKCAILINTATDSNKHNKEIKDWLDFVNNENHTFINMSTITYNHYPTSGHCYVRTEIVYRENQTRKVIVEKSSS